MRRHQAIVTTAIALGILALLFVAGRQEPRPETLQLSGPTMGTTFHVTLVAPTAGQPAEAVTADIQQTLVRINALMSTWDPQSEISRFNASTSTDWFPISSETLTVVAEAQATSRLTDGAFDITVGPLVDLWGFGPSDRPPGVPDADELAATRSFVGHERLEVRADPPALRKSDPRLRIDLSAIAKGYGVDQVAAVLDTHGYTDYLVEIGGEMRLAGHNDRGQQWQIAVEQPLPDQRSVHRVFGATDTGVATSGDYRNFFQIGEERYAHGIDPRTGRPVPWTLGSVTVLAESAMRADALATALMILGPDDAMALARSENIAALLLVREGTALVEHASPEFERLVTETST